MAAPSSDTGARPPARLPRPELTARLGEALDRGSAVVVAGPGFGKTTAVTQAVEASGRPAAWVRCRPADRDPRRLVLAIVASLRRTAPGAVDVLEDQLLGGGALVDALGAERWLLDELDALLLEPVVVVVDDAEVLQDAPEGLAVLRELVGSRSVRLAVLSRTELPLRLGRAEASGLVTRFTDADLALDAGETRALLAERTGAEPGEDEVERTLRLTRGWPLAVAMGLSAGGDAAAELHPGSPLHTFFLEEVLDPLPGAVRASVLDAALADPPAGPVPEAAQLRPFLVPAPDTAAGWRVHPLLTQFLRTQAAAERSGAERQAAWERAAGALSAAGRREEAVDAWLEAGAWPGARDELARDVPSLLRTTPDVVRRWAQAAPAGDGDEPVAQLLHGLVAGDAGHPQEAIPLLQRAAEGFRALGMADADWTARSRLTYALYYSGRFAELGAMARPGPPSARRDLVGLVVAWAAIGLAAQGRLAEARAMLDSQDGAPAAPTPEQEALVAAYLADPVGDVDSAIAHIERSQERLRLLGEDALLRTVLGRAQIAALQVSAGRPEAALAAIEDAGRALERDELLPFMRSRLRSMRALVLGRLARLDEAEATLGAAGPVTADSDRRLLSLARATVAAGRGRSGEAIAEAEAVIALGRSAATQVRHLEGAIVVDLLLAAGATGQAARVAEELLADVGERFGPAGGRFYRARLLALSAALRASEGELGAAREDLAGALAHAGEVAHHVVRFAWPQLRPVLASLLEDQEAGTVAAAVEAVDRALPGSDALPSLAAHPSAQVRAAASAAVAEAERRIPALEFHVLGGFTLRRAGREVDAATWQRPMAARLVRFLLAHRDAPVPDDVLLEAFWPDRPQRSARESLQVTVSRARAVLDAPGAGTSVLVSSQRTYRLELRPQDRVDADVFEHAAVAALAATGPDRGRLLETAVARWTGPVLPEDRYADWAADWRERLERRLRQVLVALLDLRDAEGDHDAAVDAGQRLLELDPTDEGTHRRLIASFARAGRRGHALRQYLVCRHALVEQLGLEPSEPTTALQRQVLTGRSV